MIKSLSDLGKIYPNSVCLEVKPLPAGAQNCFLFGFSLTRSSLACGRLKEGWAQDPLFQLAKLLKAKLWFPLPSALGKEGVSHPCSKLREEVSFPLYWGTRRFHASLQKEMRAGLSWRMGTGQEAVTVTVTVTVLPWYPGLPRAACLIRRAVRPVQAEYQMHFLLFSLKVCFKILGILLYTHIYLYVNMKVILVIKHLNNT